VAVAAPKRRPRRKLFAKPKEKDDLKKIYGIGPVLERALNKLGVTTFKQIARFTGQDADRVARAIKFFPDRITRDNWRGGAKKEYRKKYGKSV
jgi:predicted flap endonuclease-1-like 5' DNA nuclease